MATNATAPPLQIFVLWHPDFAEGKRLAEDILHLFQRTGVDLQEGPGIQVLFRTLPDRGKSDRLPREIPKDQADTTLIVPLVDNTLMLDDAWKRWLHDLSKRESFIVLPQR